MRLAVIDLGTNAVRFDVHEIPPVGEPRRLHRERLMVRLGEGVFRTGRLSRAAMARTTAAFQSFARTVRDLRVDKVTAFGTSALREASNSEDLITLLRRKTGIVVRVIPGAEEARLIAQGILRHEKIPKGSFALVDVGGGSVEVMLCRGRRLLRAISVDLGAARLQQNFLKTVPPRPGGMEALRRHVREVLKAAAPRGGWPSAGVIIGSGGTVRALEKIHEADEDGGGRFNAKDLDRLLERMLPLSLHRLLGIPGMEPKRAELILAGAALMAEVAEALDAKDIRPTDYALRDGILAEELRLRGKIKGKNKPSAGFDLRALFQQAARFDVDERHLRQVTGLVADLFDIFKVRHHLAPVWKERLLAAAVLHDTGESISPVHHERHSAYIARHADISFLDPWEHEFVAQLCLWHKGGKPEPSEIPFWERRTDRTAFFKLLSLLRLADAMDRGHKNRVRLAGAQFERRRVLLFLRGASDLELLRLEQKKDLFEKTFGLALQVFPRGERSPSHA
jgi:exopolyphosphatase / guanosine-5'-triphosphate,3'-diphosphate pyrophosphatase